MLIPPIAHLSLSLSISFPSSVPLSLFLCVTLSLTLSFPSSPFPSLYNCIPLSFTPSPLYYSLFSITKSSDLLCSLSLCP